MKRLLSISVLALSAMGLSISAYAVSQYDKNEIEYMEARYGEDRSQWPIYDHNPKYDSGKVEVIGGTVKDPNHGKNRAERFMGDH